MTRAIPPDHAWLLTQRSRVRAELADEVGAAADAASARVTILTAPPDPTASAITASAAEAMFRASDWDGRDLEDYITARDTAVSWWRTQNLGSAYEHTNDRAFDAWAQRDVTYNGPGHPAHHYLEAARWNANLCAHIGTWRACSTLFARQMLIDATRPDTPGDEEDVLAAVRMLQMNGDATALGHALDRLLALGPLAPLQQAVARVPLANWTAHTFRGNLELWTQAGDLLTADTADAAVAHCLALLQDQDAVPEAVRTNLDLPRLVLPAIAGLLPAVGDNVHQRVGEFLAAGSPWDSRVARQPVLEVIRRLHARVLGQEPAGWRAGAERNADPASEIRLAMLGKIAATDATARHALIRQIEDGSVAALGAFKDIATLEAGSARQAIQALAGEIDGALDRLAAGSGYTSATTTTIRALAALNSLHRDQAQWAPLLRVMGTAQVPDQFRRGLCYDLATSADHLPTRCGPNWQQLSPPSAQTTPSRMTPPHRTWTRCGWQQHSAF